MVGIRYSKFRKEIMNRVLKPIDRHLMATLTEEIRLGVKEIKKSRGIARRAIRKNLFSYRLAASKGMSVQDSDKRINDILATHDQILSNSLALLLKVCEQSVQLADTVDLASFDRDNLEERYFTDGYLQCFRDMYRKLKGVEILL